MKEKRELLSTYISNNVAPILEDFLFDIPDSVVISADVSSEELLDINEPEWFRLIKSNSNAKVLVIDRIDSISKDEQVKFLELLKYRKVGTLELPKNCVIIITANEINKNTINEEIYSLVAHIKE